MERLPVNEASPRFEVNRSLITWLFVFVVVVVVVFFLQYHNQSMGVEENNCPKN